MEENTLVFVFSDVVAARALCDFCAFWISCTDKAEVEYGKQKAQFQLDKQLAAMLYVS